jgi:hypothetical protein
MCVSPIVHTLRIVNVFCSQLCPGTCTAKFTQPVTMLHTLLHMHQAGVSISTRHIRDGVELQPLGRKRCV